MDGSLPEAINETVVALVHKIQSLESINQDRPISCCNFLNKVISRIFVNRLRDDLRNIISPNQSAFVGGRLIQDNIIVAHEVFHFPRKKRGPNSNQLSSYLFILVADVLAHLINRALEAGDISGLSLAANAPPLTHLLFADDTLFFSKATPAKPLPNQCWDHPEKYLGLPADWALKEVLIKSVIRAIPSYAMAVFKFPKGFCSKLNSIVARFWWQGSKGDAGINRRSWQVLTRSKKDGGLGFKEFSAMNQVHLAKQAWRIIQNPYALWVKVLKSVYFPNQSFLQVKKNHGGSWIWNSILQGRDFARRKGQWPVANGKDIHFLTHLPPPLAIKALQTPIAWFQQEDRLIWPYTSDGSYSIKTRYHVANMEQLKGSQEVSSSHSVPLELWKSIRNLKVPQKIKFFLWRACTNALL
ncbi:Reverse transcriptase domain [Sesbania bispinosa]|nr:Reverse transcriptase domain [Sesbania bispinosa]